MTRKRREAIRKAENLVSRGKLEAAVSQYEKVLHADASDTSTLNRLGDLYVRLRRLDEATELFRRAGEHFSREGFYVKAIAIFKKIIRLDPTRIDVYEILADLYHRQGLINEARTQYQVVADYFQQSGDTAKVVAINERMVELEPDHPTLRVRLAELYCDIGRTSEAMQQYREIATFMLAHSKVDEAVKVYRGAVDLDPQDQAYLTDALLHLKDEGYPEAARELLSHGVSRNPEAARIAVLTGLREKPPRERRGRSADEAEAATALDEAPAAPEAIDEEPEPDEAAVDERGAAAAAPTAVDEAGEGAPAPPAVEEEEAAEPGPPAGPEPTVFLDLEDADEVPYSVGRQVRADDTGEIEIELDLGELEPVEAPTLAIEPTPADATSSAEPEAPPAAPPEAAPPPDPDRVRADELFHEARVLSNYGLEDKAAELLAEVLDLTPDHLEARLLAARVDATLGNHEQAAEHAAGAAAQAAAEDRAAEWDELAAFLDGRGYGIDGRDVRPPPPEPVVEAAPESAAEAPAEAVGEPLETPPAVAAEAAADDGLDWLEEPAGAVAGEGAADLFGQEEDFFDLAGELEEELRREDLLDEGFDPQPAEQSLEEIVEGFRKGVAETLAAEDYDTHYNLGIAYREMGLVDEAIGEFQLAAKDPRYLVDCCSLLGACFLEKGFPDLAVKWYERGLESPNISEKETLGLLYELGNLYVATGKTEAALETFTEIYGTNSNYRDVVARLAELGGDH